MTSVGVGIEVLLREMVVTGYDLPFVPEIIGSTRKLAVVERDHWDTLFDDLYLRTYARLDRGVDDEEEALGAAALAGVEPGADVLDAPCGYGRHSIVLARAGYRVVGVDRSPVLLDEARRRAGDGEWPQWVQADHRELPFEDASFDAALNLFSALGYRGEDGDRRTLGELRRVLRPGGSLVVETMHRDRLMHIYQQRGWNPLPDGDLLIEERTFDYVAGEIETTHSLVEAGGNRESLTYRFRVYTATELVRLVEEAGFADVRVLRRLGSRGALARDAARSSLRKCLRLRRVIDQGRESMSEENKAIARREVEMFSTGDSQHRRRDLQRGLRRTRPDEAGADSRHRGRKAGGCGLPRSVLRPHPDDRSPGGGGRVRRHALDRAWNA